MQFELTHANAKLGPLLILDRAFRERWAQKSQDFILNRGHQQKTTGLRLQVPSGRVQLKGIGTTPLCEVEIPPGEYEADLFA